MTKHSLALAVCTAVLCADVAGTQAAESAASSNRPTAAAVPELFIPLSRKEEQHVMRQTNWALRKQMVGAKRSRVVVINFDALRSASAISLHAFPGEPPETDMAITVNRNSFEPMGEMSRLFEWKGTRTGPGTPVYLTRKPGTNDPLVPSPGSPNIISFTVMTEPTNLTESQVAEMRVTNPRVPFIAIEVEGELAESGNVKERVLRVPVSTLVGRYGYSRKVGNKYVWSSFWIAPVTGDPRYHIIGEISPDNQFGVGSKEHMLEVGRRRNAALSAIDEEKRRWEASQRQK